MGLYTYHDIADAVVPVEDPISSIATFYFLGIGVEPQFIPPSWQKPLELSFPKGFWRY